MVVLLTNRPEYANDIAEEIRLFLGFCDIRFESAPDAALKVSADLFEREENTFVAVASAGAKNRHELRFRLPDDARLTRKKLEKRHMKLAVYHLMRELYPSIAPPWGSLTGIRPTKLFRELSKEGDATEASRIFTETFCVSPQKTALAARVAAVQEPVIQSIGTRDLDIYVGIPFCRTRCAYCSFGSVVPKDASMLDSYLEALNEDILLGARLVHEGGYRVRAAYIGGGTPTILSAAQLNDLLTRLHRAYGDLGGELTVEAGRPDTIDREKLSVLLAQGVNRISINPQTMNDETLRRMGRAHSAADVLDAFSMARGMGFKWINMDLIAGLPGETPDDMADSCGMIERLAPENLTVHALAVKRSSGLKASLGGAALPSQEDAMAMIDIGAETAARLKMLPYYMYRQKYMSGNLENVGYAEPSFVCRYNIDMMEEGCSILSHGAGAMTKRVFNGENRIERIPAPKDVSTYMQKLEQLDTKKRAQFLD